MLLAAHESPRQKIFAESTRGGRSARNFIDRLSSLLPDQNPRSALRNIPLAKRNTQGQSPSNTGDNSN